MSEPNFSTGSESVREGIGYLLNRSKYQYVMWILFLTHRNTHHFLKYRLIANLIPQMYNF